MRALSLLLTLLLLGAILCCSSCNDSQPVAQAKAPATVDQQAAASDTVFTLPMDKPVDVKLEFAKASHSGQPGQLSDLEFSFSAACEEQPLKSESLTLNAQKPQDVSRLDLEQYKVEVRPIIDNPISLDKGSYGAYGGYRISVRSSAGDSLCCMEVDKKGELKMLGADCSKYLPYQSLALPKESKWRYTIYPKGQDTKRTALLAVEYDGGGFANQDIDDKAGNHYAYRFPNATLKIYNAQLAAALKEEVAADQSAYMGSGGAAACGSGG
jgi:hypothetical protein